MPGHPDLVAGFAAALTGGPLPPDLTATAPDEVERRMAVHRNTVAVSLTEALASRFPAIRRLVGPEFFAAMARVYAEAHRPASPVLHAWGESFAGFLKAFPPLAGYPWMADVARIEYARGVAFHAGDAPPASPQDFLGCDPARLRLSLHASVQVLHLDHPAVSIWTQTQGDAVSAAIAPSGPEIALVLRDRDFQVPVAAISSGDAAMLRAIAGRATVLAAAEVARTLAPGHDPQPLILRLMQAGAILHPKEPSNA